MADAEIVVQTSHLGEFIVYPFVHLDAIVVAASRARSSQLASNPFDRFVEPNLIQIMAASTLRVPVNGRRPCIVTKLSTRATSPACHGTSNASSSAMLIAACTPAGSR